MTVSKKIKIFVDAHSFDTEFQGARTFLKGLYNELIDHYCDFDIYFGTRFPDRLNASFPSLDKKNIIEYNSKPSFFRLAFDIPAILNKHKFDFAHFQYVVPFGKKKCKYIVTTHDLLFKDFPEKFSFLYSASRNYFFKRAVKIADIRTTVSSYSQERIEHHFKVPSSAINILPNAVDRFFVSGISSDAAAQSVHDKFGFGNYILYVSRVEPRKNHALLLKIFLKEKLFEQHIHLVFAGKYSIKIPELDSQLKHLSSSEKKFVHWLKDVSDEDLRNLYKACRLFVYPSVAEGFGIPPLEATVSGAPVICSNTTAMSEFSFFGCDLFDPNDELQLKNRIMENLNRKTDKSIIRQRAEYISNKYSWKTTAKKFYHLLQNNLQLHL